jgi:hypothetical protein
VVRLRNHCAGRTKANLLHKSVHWALRIEENDHAPAAGTAGHTSAGLQ